MNKILKTGLGLLALLYVNSCDIIRLKNPFEPDKLLRTNVEKITQQNDLELNMNMKENYNVNDYFDYNARLTNVSNINLVFNNLNNDCLEMKILDEQDSPAWKNYSTNTPFVIELYSDGGYLEQETKEDTSIMRISGARVDLSKSEKFHTKTKVPKLAIVEYWEIIESDNKIPSYLGGVYHCYIKLKYSKHDTLKIAEFKSPEFRVPYSIADDDSIPSSIYFSIQNVKMPIRRMM